MNHEYTQQSPLQSGYGARTTAGELAANKDLTGKIAIVTGGHSGLGLETARVLAEAGAKVIIPVRSLAKAAEAVARIPGAELAELDLTDPQSINHFAAEFLESHRPLHLLIHSAGIMAVPEQYDGKGNELQFSTNFLGPFQLTARLWPALVAAKEARVVIVSSKGHRISNIDFEDLDFKRRGYNKWAAYGQSKTAASLFAVELDRRGKDAGVRAFSVHPGSIVTNLSQFLSDDEMKAMGALDDHGRRAFSNTDEEKKTVPEGAATIVWCATSEQLNGMGGVYCENVNIARLMEESEDASDSRIQGVKAWATDREAAQKLWSVAESLTGTSL